MGTRPPTERDTIHVLNGAQNEGGVLVSTGTVVNNATTANPFLTGLVNGVSVQGQFMGGRTFAVQPSVDGFWLTSASAIPSMINQTTIPAPQGQQHGIFISAKAINIVIMRPDVGFIQWLPSTGSGNLFVWELT